MAKVDQANGDKNRKEIYLNIEAISKSIVESDERDVRILKHRDLRHNINMLKKNTQGERVSKEKFDVVIFTIVPVEFLFSNKVLKFMKPNDHPDFNISGLGYHKFEIKRKNNLPALKAAVTLVGTAGDVNCSLACSQFFSFYDCDLAILCGISAGLKGKAPIYSTVIGRNIVNYEFQRIEKDAVTFRPIPFAIDRIISNSLTNLAKYKSVIVKEIKANIKKLLANDKAFDQKLLNQIDVIDGVIASGAKLLADGKTLKSLREDIPIGHGIIAAEMEGSGFAPACELFRKKWMVFRGVSDYGDADKSNQKNKKYQFVAVVSAVTTMLYFLTNYYETLRESDPKINDLKL